MKRIIITGAAGFIGSHLVDSLLDLGVTVIASDNIALIEAVNLLKAQKHKNFSYFQVDVTDLKSLEILFTDKIDTIYHYASVVGVQRYLDFPQQVINVNIIGTQNIVNLALKYNAKIVLASTSEVYGKNPAVPWAEDDDRVLGSTLFERWTYSSSKAIAEHIILANLKNLDLNWLIVRYFNVYGPRQNSNFVVSGNLKNYILKKPLECHNDGTQTRCYTYIDNAVQATIGLSEKDKKGVFNIGSEVEISVNELLSLINKLNDFKSEILYIDTSQSMGKGFEDIQRRVPNTKKIQSEIDWKATTPLREGLMLTYNWILDNDWWLKR